MLLNRIGTLSSPSRPYSEGAQQVDTGKTDQVAQLDFTTVQPSAKGDTSVVSQVVTIQDDSVNNSDVLLATGDQWHRSVSQSVNG